MLKHQFEYEENDEIIAIRKYVKANKTVNDDFLDTGFSVANTYHFCIGILLQ